MFELNGKTALVTGSTQGIGFEIARMLSKHGAAVFVHGASSMEKCCSASKRIPNSVPVRADLLKYAEVDKLYDQTGNVDILVLNASVQYKKRWDECTLEDFDNQMNCNVKSTYLLMRKYVPAMKEKGWGRIVTIGSVNQHNQHPELPLYGVTKAAQMKLVLSVAKDIAPYGITVNNVSPGAIDTPRNAEVLENLKFKKKVENSIPCGYIGIPEDVTPVVLMLCSKEGRYITGADIKIDGGMSL